MKKLIPILGSFFILFSACKKEHNNFLPPTAANENKLSPQKQVIADQVKSRLDLITFISMDIFETNQNLKKEVLSIIQQNRKSGKGEVLYFKDILSSSQLITSNFKNTFLSEFAKRLETGKFHYANRVKEELILARDKGKIKTSSLNTFSNFGDWDFNYLTLAHIGSYIYFPFSENFENTTGPLLHYTHDPLNPQAAETEVFWNNGQEFSADVVSGQDSWAAANAVWVFLLDDVIAGNHYDNYVKSPCASGDFFAQLCNNELLPPDRTLPTQTSPPPPPNTAYNGPLENNIPPYAHATITNDKYLLSSSIPRIRIKRNVRPGGFWNGSNRIQLYRANARIANPNRANFSEAIMDTSLAVISEKKISRKDGRNGTWVQENSVYTYQWKQEQFEHYVVVTYVAHWLYFEGADIDYEVNAGVEWNNTLQTWVPKFDAKVKVKGKISIQRKREKIMGEIYIPRASFMANAIGNNFGLGTCHDTGAPYCERAWSVRSIGDNFEFYWRVNITY
ncbi:MAG: hypothetical protein IM577_15165 [Chitinophagaceae bacterium]|nr:hypothetical protein [Chitinophagaceae bacterium]